MPRRKKPEFTYKDFRVLVRICDQAVDQVTKVTGWSRERATYGLLRAAFDRGEDEELELIVMSEGDGEYYLIWEQLPLPVPARCKVEIIDPPIFSYAIGPITKADLEDSPET